jgi:hypothetical protein
LTRLSEILGPDIHGDSGDPAASPALYVAEVTAVVGTTATVIVPGYSSTHDYDQVPFMPRGATNVAPGDNAWVAFDDERSPVIVCWTPA